MKKFYNKWKIYTLGFLIFLFFSIFHMSIMSHYSLSWDYHYHHFAGLYHLGLPVPKFDEKTDIPFTAPDPRLTVEDPFGPFTQIIPSLSQYLLYDRLNFLTLTNGYNFPMVISGSAGLGILFIFVASTLGVETGFISVLFLGLLPVYFEYLHNDMKDIPNAVFFTLSIYMFWRLENKPDLKRLFLAVVSFAIAFNIKINSVFIPVICGVWLVAINIRHIVEKRKLYFLLSYFIFAPVSAILLWWPFWRNPLGKLLELPHFYSLNTYNMPVLLSGNIYRSGVNMPWFYPYLYIAITTPLPILIFFIIGLYICFKKITSKEKIYPLMLIWFFIPIVRYFSPKAGAIDGVRHFMEIVFPLSFIAAAGFTALLSYLKKFNNHTYLKYFLIFIISVSLIRNIIVFHPYESSFFNMLIGGIEGANNKFDINFWGTPQKEAVDWLNNHASYDSKVYILMAQSTAAIYARDDLKKNINKSTIEDSDYVVILNRPSFYTFFPDIGIFRDNKINSGKSVYTRKINGIPLVWVLGK